jgi:L-asparagine oxygenase
LLVPQHRETLRSQKLSSPPRNRALCSLTPHPQSGKEDLMASFSLSNEERRCLEDALRTAPNPYVNPMQAQVFAHRNLLAAGPEWLLEEMYRLKSDATAPGYLHIKNGPLGFVPDTPLDGDGRDGHRDFIAHSFILGSMQEFGYILTNRAEKGGAIPADITPIPGMGASKSNAGFSEPLGLHTENIHLPEERRPTYVGLYTLRGDPKCQAETLVADAGKIVAFLDTETVRQLRKPSYVIKISDSFKSGLGRSAPMPVITGPEDLPRITTEFNSTVCLTNPAKVAFQKLKDAALRARVVIRLESGDLLIACNRRTIHGRGRFTPDFSAKERRWLFRVCTVADPFELRDMVAPGAHRVFDLGATIVRDMIIRCSGVSGIPKVEPPAIPLQEVRAAMKRYDAWINQFSRPSSIPDLPGFELVLFVANTIARGELLKDLSSSCRIHLALRLMTLNAGIEPGYEIDKDNVATALATNAGFGELLRVCARLRTGDASSSALASQQTAERFAAALPPG